MQAPLVPSNARDRLWNVVRCAALSRVIVLLLGIASNTAINDYDSSASLVLPAEHSVVQRATRRLAQTTLHWDAFYFTHIAGSGYVYEQEHAFFPLLPLLMRLLAHTVFVPLEAWIGRQLALVLAGIVISNVSFVLAAATLYKLALLYALAPSGMFMSAVYTESLFAWLVFTALLHVARRRYMWAALWLCASTLCRSNGIIYAGFFWWNLVVWPNTQQPSGSTANNQQKTVHSRILLTVLRITHATALTAVAALGFVAFQMYGYHTLCQQPLHPQDTNARPYCSGAATVYSFVQEHYWDIGFLRYYTVNQIPNFVLAAPMAVLSVAGLWTYTTWDPLRIVTLGMQRRTEVQNSTRQALLRSAYFGDGLLPHMYLWALLLAVAVTTMHVQMVARFFSSVPAVFWFAAHVVVGDKQRQKYWRRMVVGYFAGYGLAGVVLFSNFFPPA
ncbi:GPI mannosyltransferase 2 [Coemansia spiralis]|nr:GPI mannosyltransferase 2 [Coemansia spiralis]